MSSRNEASLRLTIAREGFSAGLNQLESDIRARTRRMGAQFGMVGQAVERSTKQALNDLAAVPKVMSKLTTKDVAKGALAGIKSIETSAAQSAKRIAKNYEMALRDAFRPKPGDGKFGTGTLSRLSDRDLSRAASSIRGGLGFGGGGMESASPSMKGSISGFAVGAGMAIVSTAVSAGMAIVNKGVDLTRDAYDVNQKALSLSVSARDAGGKYLDPGALQAEFYKTAADVKGTTANEAGEAAQAFYALTGDINTARSSLATFATVARATDGSMVEVAQSAASISQQFKITDPGEMQDVFATLVYQGKAGAIELKDLAHGLQKLAAAGAAFGLKGTSGIKTVGGLTQIARRGTGSADQAFTAVENIFAHISEKSKVLEKEHVKVYEGKGANKHTRDIKDILVDTIAKVGGSDIAKKNEKLQSIFGMEGIRGIKPLISIYQDAYTGLKGKDGKDPTKKERMEAGMAALREEMDKAINSTAKWADVVSDAAQKQQTAGAQWTAAMEQFKGKLSTEVLPQLSTFVSTIASQPEILRAFGDAIVMTGKGLSHLMKMLGITKDHQETVGKEDWKKASKEQAAQDALVKKAGSAEQGAAARAFFLGQGDVKMGEKLAAEKVQADEAARFKKPGSMFAAQSPVMGMNYDAEAHKKASLGQATGTAGPAPHRVDLKIPDVMKVILIEDNTKGGATPGYAPRR